MKSALPKAARLTILATTALAVGLFTVNAAQSQAQRRTVPVGPSEPFLIQERALPPAQALPVQNVVIFETEFTRRLNDAIRFHQAARQTEIVHTKVYRDWVDDTIWRYDNAKAAQLPTAELQELRNLINRGIDQAVTDQLAGRAGLTELGEGTIGENFFTGKVHPPAGHFGSSPRPAELAEPRIKVFRP